MKLSDIQKGETSDNAGLLIGGGYEVIFDPMICTEGKAYAWDDALIARSMDDDIIEIVRLKGSIKDLWKTLNFHVSPDGVPTINLAPPGYASLIKLIE